MEVDDQLWTSNASPVMHLFQNKVMFLLKIMIISDGPPLSSQPPLTICWYPEGGHLIEVQLYFPLVS